MKKSHIMGVAAGTIFSTAFMLSGCEKQDLYLSEHGTYTLSTDRGTFVLDKTVAEHDGFTETLSREVAINFAASDSPGPKDFCVIEVYRAEGDNINFKHSSRLAKAYLQAAPDRWKSDIIQKFRDAEARGAAGNETIVWRATLECGQAVKDDFPQALKEISTLRHSAR